MINIRLQQFNTSHFQIPVLRLEKPNELIAQNSKLPKKKPMMREKIMPAAEPPLSKTSASATPTPVSLPVIAKPVSKENLDAFCEATTEKKYLIPCENGKEYKKLYDAAFKQYGEALTAFKSKNPQSWVIRRDYVRATENDPELSQDVKFVSALAAIKETHPIRHGIINGGVIGGCLGLIGGAIVGAVAGKLVKPLGALRGSMGLGCLSALGLGAATAYENFHISQSAQTSAALKKDNDALLQRIKDGIDQQVVDTINTN